MDHLLELSFLGLAVLFTVWNLAILIQFRTYRRVLDGAELTWYPKRPWFYNMCLGIGFFMLSMTALSLFVLHRPGLTIVSQALMALYSTFLFPLSFRFKRGFYRAGIWSERGFVPYRRVRSINWIEKPDIILIVGTEGGLLEPGYRRLQLQGDQYGQARRILAGHIEDHSLAVEKSILGLSDTDSQTPAQEQV
jgi:hypothetical protein